MATRVISQESLDQPLVRRKSLSVNNSGGMKSVVDCGEAGTFITDEPVSQGGTGAGPSPLQTVVAALCACEAVTFKRAANDVGFQYRGIEFDSSFTVDVLGRMNVRPKFQTIRVQAAVATDESEERLRTVVEEAERRCPVFNLIADAGVNIEMLWVRRAGK